MKIPRFLLVFFACMIVLAAAAFYTPTKAHSTYFLGITLTPTNEPPATDTPEPPPPATNTPEPPPATATSEPTLISPTLTAEPTLISPTVTAQVTAQPTLINPTITVEPTLINPTPTFATPVPTITPETTPTQTPDPGSDDDDNDPLAEILPSAGIAFDAAAADDSDQLSAALPRPVAQLVISRLGLNVPIRPVTSDGFSWDISNLGGSVGWLAETSLPGEEGNSVLVGHVTDLHALPPFRALEKLKPGDAVKIITPQWTYVYQVGEHTLVEPDDLSVLQSEGSAQLTLITCAEWSKSTQKYLKRLVVTANFQDQYPTPQEP